MQCFCMDSYQLQHYKDNSRTQTISSKKKKNTCHNRNCLFFFFFPKNFLPYFYACWSVSRQIKEKWQVRTIRLRFSSLFLLFGSVIFPNHNIYASNLFSYSPWSSSGPSFFPPYRSLSLSTPEILPETKQGCLSYKSHALCCWFRSFK